VSCQAGWTNLGLGRRRRRSGGKAVAVELLPISVQLATCSWQGRSQSHPSNNEAVTSSLNCLNWREVFLYWSAFRAPTKQAAPFRAPLSATPRSATCVGRRAGLNQC